MRIVAALRARLRRVQRDGGFSLIEVMVALGLMVFAMVATEAFFLRSMARTDVQQQRQSASALADRVMEDTRAVPASKLLTGRDKTRTDALWAAPGQVDTSQSFKVWDSTATSASVETVKFSVSGSTDATFKVDNVNYTVRTFVDGCWLTPAATVCDASYASGDTRMYRVSVDVQWSPGRGQTCTAGTTTCEYVVSTLRDPSPDHTFNENRPNG